MTAADTVRSYLKADIDQFTTLKLEGDMVDLMVQVNPEKYAEYIRYENGKQVLYLRLLKAIYGCIRPGLL